MEKYIRPIKPDVMMVWPSGVDYPLCRWQLQAYRSFFDKVIISTYDHGMPDFRPFLKQVMKKTTFVDSGIDNDSWRERCTLSALGESESEWVLFTEQDFLWKAEHFLYKIFAAAKDHDVIGIRQGERLHPCFLLVKKSTLDKTHKDFSVNGDGKDHFWNVSQELLKVGKFKDIRDLGLFEGVDWYHFSSLTWNLFRIKDGDVMDFHEVNEFLVYNTLSRTKKVTQDARWIAFTFYAETLLTRFGKFMNY
jgi:molybdopterin-guanine dinucleotide biosynthesis protein A